jgi:hypothetical protein
MTNFPYFRFALLFLFVWVSIHVYAQKPTPRNYVVLLDLSDRLLAPGQAGRDQALILDMFQRFEQDVRRNLIINSRDCFQVVIAPQQGAPYEATQQMAGLFLTMEGPIQTKRQRLDAFKAELPKRLRTLYGLATGGKNKPSDYRGCDIWQYFNEQLPTDLLPAHENTLLVLTDGYFDFEKNTHRKQQGNRYTDSQQLMPRLRGQANWQQVLQKPEFGLLPVPKQFPRVRVWVAEFHPKVDHLDELDILKAIWTKWLREMRIASVQCLARAPLPKVQEALRRLP